jgi:signal transduction histidine kinase
VATEKRGLTRRLATGWAGRVAGFFLLKEERPVPSASARAADAAIAALVTIVSLTAAILAYLHPDSASVFVVPTPGGLHQPVGPFYPRGSLSVWILLGVALTTAPLAFRRTYPIAAFCVILAALIGTSGTYSNALTFGAAILAAYSAVAYSAYRRAAMLSVLAAAIIVTVIYPNTTPPVPERFTAVLVLIPTVAVGIAIRVWRRRAGESAERLRRAQQEHEAETRRAVQLERARIASEMHDVVTHNVSVMVVQAGAARRVLDSSPGDAREALLAVEASGRTAMTELRHLLGLLAPATEGEPGAGDAGGAAGLAGAGHAGGAAGLTGAAGLPDASGQPAESGSPAAADTSGDPVTSGAAAPEAAKVSRAAATSGADITPGAAAAVGASGPVGAGGAALSPQPGLAQIPALLARVQAVGLPIELSVDVSAHTRRTLPPGLDLAAYRVVQEALTNVMKHAGQARTTVRIEYRPRELRIIVSDDGRPPDSASNPAPGQPAGSGGRGLIGLRERIAVYGGELDAGPRPGGGWRLVARIPLDPLAGESGDPGRDLPVPPEYQAAPS